MIDNTDLDRPLALLEQQMLAAQQGLLHGGADDFLALCRELQVLAVGMMQAAGTQPGRHPSTEQSRQFEALAFQFSALRESLARRSAFVDRALEIVVPTDSVATYPHKSTYGTAPRQSGAFKVLAA